MKYPKDLQSKLKLSCLVIVILFERLFGFRERRFGTNTDMNGQGTEGGTYILHSRALNI